MMITVHSLTGSTSSFTAPAVLTEEANLVLVAQACRVYAANRRQGTAKTKSRGEVNRTTKKMYKQKGTGGARHASRRAPIFVGGGVTFGPRGNQNWSLTLTRKQKSQALLESLRAQKENVVVLADVAAAKGKTQAFAKRLAAINPDASFLVIYELAQQTDLQGAQNLAQATVRVVSDVNALDVVSADVVVITKEAWESLVKRLGADVQGRLKKTDSATKKAEKPVAQAKKTAATVSTPAQKTTKTTAVAKAAPTKTVKTTKTTAAKKSAAPKTKKKEA